MNSSHSGGWEHRKGQKVQTGKRPRDLNTDKDHGMHMNTQYIFLKSLLCQQYSEGVNILYVFFGLPWWLSDKESSCRFRKHRFDPWSGNIPWRRKWHPTPVFLPRKSHGQRSPVGYSPCGCKESDMTYQLNSNNNTFSMTTIFMTIKTIAKLGVTMENLSLSSAYILKLRS